MWKLLYVVVSLHRWYGKAYIMYYSFPELIERQYIFPGKYLNEARKVFDFPSDWGATIKDIFGHPSPKMIPLVTQK